MPLLPHLLVLQQHFILKTRGFSKSSLNKNRGKAVLSLTRTSSSFSTSLMAAGGISSLSF